jgi:diguanylate cyclase (GGDEF)-like protein
MRAVEGLMPQLRHAPPRARALAGAAGAAMLAMLAVHVAHTTLGLGSDGLAAGAQSAGIVALLVVLGTRAATARRDRGSWTALTAAATAWTAGSLWADMLAGADASDVASVDDVFFMLFYPLAYVAIGLRARTRFRRAVRSTSWDGAIAMLSIGALGWIVAVDPFLTRAPHDQLVSLVDATYVVGDLLLTALTVAVLGVHGWRGGRSIGILAAGLAVFAAADSLYMLRAAYDAYTPGTPIDSLWGVGLVLMALAAWQPPDEEQHGPAGLTVLAAPFAFSLISLGVLVYAGLGSAPAVAVVLAGGAVLASMARTAVTFTEVRGFAEVRRLAATDDLTGLPNRRQFHRRLTEVLEAARTREASVALLLIDLDRFKELNDTLGHRAGDLLLGQIGPRLRAVLRSGDELARLGGDEFAVLLADAADAEPVGRRIGRALEESFTIDGIDVRIGASIGIAVFPDHGDDADTLVQRADVAMYQAKAARSGHAFYERERDRHSRERLALIGELREAIGTDQLVLHYQPKLDLASGEVRDVEALVRWMHPTRGLLAPGAFVPLAEQTGVMGALTNHVLDAALAQVARWYEQGLDLSVAVNVSAETLLDEGWVVDVSSALVRHGVPASRLRIEITEDALVGDPDRALRVVESLVATGCGVSLDDFGTGYSSLSLLKHLPVDELKIDRGFVRDLLTDSADAAIVRSVIDLGGRFGARTVAEGVEDEATLRRLADDGVTLAQGFHIARPLPPAELEAWLEARAAENIALA